jgi:hypothetical protein
MCCAFLQSTAMCSKTDATKTAQRDAGAVSHDAYVCLRGARTPPLRDELVLSNIGLITLAAANRASVAAGLVLSGAIVNVNTYFAHVVVLSGHVRTQMLPHICQILRKIAATLPRLCRRLQDWLVVWYTGFAAARPTRVLSRRRARRYTAGTPPPRRAITSHVNPAKPKIRPPCRARMGDV